MATLRHQPGRNQGGPKDAVVAFFLDRGRPLSMLSNKAFAPWAQAVTRPTAEGALIGLNNAASNGRQWLESVRFLWRQRVGRPPATPARPDPCPSHPFTGGTTTTGTAPWPIPIHRLSGRLLSWACDSYAATLRREAAKRLAARRGFGFALVGLTFTAKDGILGEKDKRESVCQQVRVTVSASIDNKIQTTAGTSQEFLAADVITLKDLRLGCVIAKGCNAIVHAASWRGAASEPIVCPKKSRTDSSSSDDSGTESSIEVLVSDEEESSDNPGSPPRRASPAVPPTVLGSERGNIGARRRTTAEELCVSLARQPLAVKMMFNYEAESNAPAILAAMYKEIVPARVCGTFGLYDGNDSSGRRKRLPPHPNIVAMHCTFADSVPDLPLAMALYPDALPRRLNRNGAGRNMTLFLVMKRYNCSLQEYLHLYDPSPRTCLLLITQLLEGVVHLLHHRIAHRDLKSDNILLDLGRGLDGPRLVITDFGCCLADTQLGLRLPYYTSETAKWGNSALMAPEVAGAVPGAYVSIDYTKADLWALATLAYEILGQPNPFYRVAEPRGGLRFDSRNYQDNCLPGLGVKAHPILSRLITQLLRRNPQQRPSATVAANVCILLLFGPEGWFDDKCPRLTSDAQVLQWLVSFAAQTILAATDDTGSAEHHLAVTFLKRANLEDLLTAVQFLKG